ncbi:sulfate permease [Pseudomassariella vexata]|uniref:Sulfate permease n=1 Tax=Pseudomassariella vexata TaxID=1141098 RepID=A0A1Y2DI00_9PEZI|nr:sulfate permease [Pseudomassariella vexata]ORY58857.1 sulfate permease [Pseudomassariella vexata]
MGLFNANRIRHGLETDETLSTVRRMIAYYPAKLPSSAAQYAISMVPIVQWLPRYNVKWLISDFISGLTIAVMLIPQALAYAKIATIPGEFGLYSSWLPAAVYVFMGTSKDLSTGPTSIMGLLTAEVIAELTVEGYKPEAISSAIAMMVGVYALMLGLFRLGFVLNFVSSPVLSGFISAAALNILLGQVGSLVGLDVGTGPAAVIHDVLTQIPQMEPLTVAIGFGGIFFLCALEWSGKKWGKRVPVLKFLSSSRAVLALVIFTTISFVVNRNLEDPVWALSKVKAYGIIPPRTPDTELLMKVAGKSITPVLASSLEHLSLGKAFGRKNNYVIDQSQELVYLGVINSCNSFFGAMSVGGAMSRTAVNSECGVRSPLGGAVTAGFILLTIYKLAGVLFWIPKATLSAIIIMAVIHLVGPVSIFTRFWHISFADFTASMLAFWITLFAGTETGIAVAVLYSIGYTLVRLTFSKTFLTSRSATKEYSVGSSIPHAGAVPDNVVVVHFADAVFFPNAERVKTQALESIQARHLPQNPADKDADDRSWSVAAEKRLEFLRKMDHITPTAEALRVIVLDFTRVPFLDVTGVKALQEFRVEIEKYLGCAVELRLVGMSKELRRKLERAKWPVVDSGGDIRDTGAGDLGPAR